MSERNIVVGFHLDLLISCMAIIWLVTTINNVNAFQCFCNRTEKLFFQNTLIIEATAL